MLELTLPRAKGRATRILCVGAHCDDIEIGCGGTLLKLLGGRGAWDVTWAVFSADQARTRELRASAQRFLKGARRTQLLAYQFTDSFFPGEYTAIKRTFATLRRLPEPDIVFTHERNDRHQDHRLLAELTWNLFRDHLLLEYEIPKYEGGLTTPNALVPLSAAQAAGKVRALLASYPSQRAKPWFRAETFHALMRLRGVEAGAASGWAEGFHAAKLSVG
jgi:LmbE family N-acetylglucosaminyl deacetylase